MTNYGWHEVSGEGDALLDGGTAHNVLVLLAHIGTVTSARVRLVGTETPKRVQFGGSIGLAGNDLDHNDVSQIEYGYQFHMNFERCFFFPHAGRNNEAYADRIWWRLPPGITWWIDAIW